MIPTRAAGLERLHTFVPSMGRAYATRRNFDLGAGAHSHVSMLSPYLRRRLLTEREVVEAALAAHSAADAEKFIQEVFWRTYWKGWLEHRPSVWDAYRNGLVEDHARIASDRRLATALTHAEDGTTEIDCFDAWARELVETNYLHNHARMWFASIWIFTLQLPWRLGADFFLRHLLDGDAASNTLGWRWVAGLHTRGKHYVAAPWNIEKFTEGRFAPAESELAKDPEPLIETFDPGEALPVREEAAGGSGPTALLITDDDCSPESLGLSLDTLCGAATLCLSQVRPVRDVADAVQAFDRGALADAARRAHEGGAPEAAVLDHPDAAALIDWAQSVGASNIVTAFLPTGPTRDWMLRALPDLTRAGITLTEVQRPWDSDVWPHATAGFFKLKKKIPSILSTL